MLAAAARSADVTLDVLVDLNVGMYRCGIYWESVEGEQRPLPCVFACAHNRHGLGALEAIPKPAQTRSPPRNSLRADIVALCKLAHSLEGVRFKGLMGCARTHAASCHKAHTAALLLRWPVVLAFRSCLEGRDCRVFKNTRTRFSRVLDCIHYYCKIVLYIYKKTIKVQPSRIYTTQKRSPVFSQNDALAQLRGPRAGESKQRHRVRGGGWCPAAPRLPVPLPALGCSPTRAAHVDAPLSPRGAGAPPQLACSTRTTP